MVQLLVTLFGPRSQMFEPELPYLIDISVDLAYVGDSGQAPISSFSSRGQEISKR